MPYEDLKAKIPSEGSRCKKLCGKCCINTAPVGKSEAEEIGNWLVKNVTVEDLTAQFHHYDNDPAACPFLKPDKTCFIYPVRPVVCHTFGHLEDVPGTKPSWSQKCPEGVEFTEVKFVDIAHETTAWMNEIDKESINTMDFRFAGCTNEDGTQGVIPVLKGSALEKLMNAKGCTRCQKPFVDDKAYLEGADLLCYECGKEKP